MSKFLDKIPIDRIVTILKNNWELLAICVVGVIVLLIVVLVVMKILEKRGHFRVDIP